MPLYMPQLYKKETSRSMTANFYGLNHNLKIADGEWYDMENLTSDHLPVAAVRDLRKKLTFDEGRKPQNPVAVVSAPTERGGIEEPIWVEKDGRMRFGFRDTVIDLTEYGFETNEPNHNVVLLGAFAVILPELISVNIYSEDPTRDNGVQPVREKYTYSYAVVGEGEKPNALLHKYRVTFSTCDYEGALPTYVQAENPAASEGNTLKNGDTWYDSINHVLNRYDEESNAWYEIEQYTKFDLERWYYDTNGYLTWSGKIQFDLEGIEAGVVLNIDGTGMKGPLYEFKGNQLVAGGDRYKFWIAKALGAPVHYLDTYVTGTFEISFAIPEMDYVIEAGNRLWGCRFGAGGSANEIYCSARGDISRWIAGPSDNEDSPVTFSLGEGGAFTGAVNYNGVPVFFKRNRMIRVEGVGASGFYLNEIPCNGIGIGNSKSAAIVNNVLYYKSENEIVRYDGSVPVSVSEGLGDLNGYDGESSGYADSKYYIRLVGKTGKNPNFVAVLETVRGIWTKESDMPGLWAQAANDIYIAESEKIQTATGQGDEDYFETDEKRVEWYAESGIIGLETPDEKYITRLAIRLKLEAGAHVRVLIQYDSSGEWEQVMAAEFVGMRTVTVPVHPHKYDHMRYRLEGEGGCQIFSVTKTLERAGRR